MKKILLTCFMLVFVFYAWAQDRTVSGTVTDAETGEPLPGVNVVLKGTGKGMTTNIDGTYKISVPSEGGTLVFSFIGMKKQEVQIGSRTVVDVQMSTDVKQLTEVIVTGYKPVTKESSNISATTIDAGKIEARPNPSVVQTLSGQVPGLNIATNSGQPGASSSINLRGIGSINGDTEPLFIIDGIPANQDNFRSLNPNEIESINVLKDAGATAIYGNRGANGVIVITTKSGKFDSPLEVTYLAQYITSELQGNDYNLLSSPDQLRLEREYRSGRGHTGGENGLPLSDEEIAATETFDWFNYFFRPSQGINQNLQFRKGGDNIASYTSFGFYNNDGILRNTGLTRYNLRQNINGKSNDDKFTYSLNLSINYSENEEVNSIGTSGINQNFVLGAYQSVPYITPDDYTNGADLVRPLSFTNTPLFLIDKLRTFTRVEDEIKGLGALDLSYEIIEGLTIRNRITADYQQENRLTAQSPESFNAILFAETGNNTPGFQSQQNRQEFTWNNLTSLGYSFTIADRHNFYVGANMEFFKARLETFGYTANGIDIKTFDPGDGSSFVADNSSNDFFVDNANANILENALHSYFGQIDYDFDSKYGVTGVIRRDAAARFFGSNRWGTFGSVSARWNIHREAFMENSIFDILKLRASYGTNGNQNITGGTIFSALDLYRPLFATGAGYGGANSIFLSQIPNNTLRWETVAQTNVGVDAELFRGRLRANLDVYRKVTTDLFQSTLVSAVNATTAIQSNIGSMQNRGIDVGLGYDVVRAENEGDLNISLEFVGNYNENEILELPDGAQELVGTGRVGGPIFEYYDYRYAGVNPANGNLLFYTAAGNEGQGNLTETPDVDNDRVWLNKNIYPDYIGSASLNVDYKGFFLQAQLNYTIGVDRYDFDLAGFMDPTSIGQFRNSNDILRAWTPSNTNTDVPSLRAANIGLDGTRWLTNADYARLRFASFGYNFPQDLLDRANIRLARIFVNGENLFTLTDWRGFDAEAQSNTSRIYPTPRTITVGLELGF